MTYMIASEGHDSKADTAYSKCPSKIKIKSVSDQLFIESFLFEKYKGGWKYNASFYLKVAYDMLIIEKSAFVCICVLFDK